jgi:gamma-glutamylcyclotransferase (GGCT)/AIG2-like uncharacterized protein YtfP
VFSPQLKKQLTAVLRKVNQARRLNSEEAAHAARNRLIEFIKTAEMSGGALEGIEADDVLYSSSRLLAVYGSLRPGQQNFYLIESISGEWFTGTTEGELGLWRQYKRLIVDSGVRNQIPVDVLRSSELPQHWDRLDQFEGPAYERILWPVTTSEGLIVASLYVRPG